MTEQTSTYLCNSAVKTPVEYKKTVEYNLGKKEEKRQFCIPAKKFQSKHNGIHSSRKTLESNRTGSYLQTMIFIIFPESQLPFRFFLIREVDEE